MGHLRMPLFSLLLMRGVHALSATGGLRTVLEPSELVPMEARGGFSPKSHK